MKIVPSANGFPKSLFAQADDLPLQWFCGRCKNIMRHPCQLSTGEMMCTACVSSSEQSYPLAHIELAIQQRPVRCQRAIEKNGLSITCTWQGPMSQAHVHEAETCPLRTVKCPHVRDGCPVVSLLSCELQDHLAGAISQHLDLSGCVSETFTLGILQKPLVLTFHRPRSPAPFAHGGWSLLSPNKGKSYTFPYTKNEERPFHVDSYEFNYSPLARPQRCLIRFALPTLATFIPPLSFFHFTANDSTRAQDTKEIQRIEAFIRECHFKQTSNKHP